MVSRNANNTAATPKHNILSQFKWAESYTSLLLGIIVVVIAGIILALFARSRHIQSIQNTTQVAQKPAPTVHKTVVQNMPPTPNKSAATENGGNKANASSYTVQPGDNLWAIAEKTTGTGYNWVKIAQANNLSSPGLIHVGNNLVIPSLAPVTITQAPQEAITPTPSPILSPTNGPNAITGYEYTVQKDDTLWSIAERAYGSGYKWEQIAQANNLSNPGVIHSGNVLKIPRPKIL